MACALAKARFDGQRLGVDVPAAPECLIAFDNSRLELVPQGLSLRPVLLERLIEPEDLGGEGLQIGLLGRIVSETDADQRSQNQRQQQADQPRHLTDDALQLSRLVRLRQSRLEEQSGISGGHEHNENDDADH